MEVLSSGYYPDRTIKNVEDADGTLVVSHGLLKGGSALTFSMANIRQKPCLHVKFDRCDVKSGVNNVVAWLEEYQIKTLNVAGPRSSSDRQIYELTRRLITLVIDQLYPRND